MPPRAGGLRSQTFGIETERLHSAVGPLRWQLLAIERDVQGPHISCFDHDFVASLDCLFRGRGERILHDLLSVSTDRNPRILARLYPHEKGSRTRHGTLLR